MQWIRQLNRHYPVSRKTAATKGAKFELEAGDSDIADEVNVSRSVAAVVVVIVVVTAHFL